MRRWCPAPLADPARHSRLVVRAGGRYRNLSSMFRPQARDKAGEHRHHAGRHRRDADQLVLIGGIRSTSDNVIKYASHLLDRH